MKYDLNSNKPTAYRDQLLVIVPPAALTTETDKMREYIYIKKNNDKSSLLYKKCCSKGPVCELQCHLMARVHSADVQGYLKIIFK